MSSAPPAEVDVLALGIVVADHVCAPADFMPHPGQLALTPATRLVVGGCAANVSVDLATLGRRVRLGGRVGDDPFGRFLADEMRQAGVCCDALTVDESSQTACTFVINIKGEDRRFIHALGANSVFRTDAISEEELRAARIVYVGGFGLLPGLTGESVRELFRVARSHGVRTVLDVVFSEDMRTAWDEVAKVLPETDLFLPNDDEAALLMGTDRCSSVEEVLIAADRFRASGARTVVITRGGHGAVLVSESERLVASAVPVEAVDATGTGDAFASGFLHALLAEQDNATALRWGGECGAACASQMGSTTGMPSAEELESLARHSRVTIDSL